MKIIVAIVFACLAVVTVSASPAFTTKYDNIDLDKILMSDRLLNSYFNCVMDKGSCTPDGKELKEALPSAIATDCQECSQKQKDGTEKVILFLIRNKPDMWDQLVKKFDPEDKHRAKWVELAKKDTPKAA